DATVWPPLRSTILSQLCDRLQRRSQLGKEELPAKPSLTPRPFSWIDHLIRPLQERLRDLESEGLRGLEVDDQLELYRRLDGKLVRRRTLEDAIGISRRALKTIEQVISVGQQPAQFNEITKRIDGRKTVASSQRCNLFAMVDQE